MDPAELREKMAYRRAAGKSYEDAVGSRWVMKTELPEKVKSMLAHSPL